MVASRAFLASFSAFSAFSSNLSAINCLFSINSDLMKSFREFEVGDFELFQKLSVLLNNSKVCIRTFLVGFDTSNFFSTLSVLECGMVKIDCNWYAF